MPKKIVYLFGSGATHAVANILDPSKGLLTSHVRDQIRKQEATLKDLVFPPAIWNELIDEQVDIEHLISIQEANYNYAITGKLKKVYSNAISLLSKDIVEKLTKFENLYSVLFDLYNVKGFAEEISCVLTLNYEDILEQSINAHLGHDIDYIIENSTKNSSKNSVSILKLHGSFNWKNIRPVEIDDVNQLIDKEESLWIPPGVVKKKENYPFNLLWGKAFEYLMNCDVLRIIGCSLNRNDWDLIPMIYTTKNFNSKSKTFDIEIIDFPTQCDKVIEQYQYLNIKHFFDIPEVLTFLIRQHYPHLIDSKDIPEDVYSGLKESIVPEKNNIFEMWLQAVGEDMMDKGIEIKTRGENIFETFIRNRLRS